MRERELVHEFQQRRTRFIRYSIRVLPLCAAGICLLLMGNTLDGTVGTVIFLVGFSLFGMSIVLITKKVIAIYRCPKCDEVPMGGWLSGGGGGIGLEWGIILNPRKCPNCGTILKT